MEAKAPFFGLRAYRAPHGLLDVVERSTNLLGYLELPGGLEKNKKNFDIHEEMAIRDIFGCGVAQNRYV